MFLAILNQRKLTVQILITITLEILFLLCVQYFLIFLLFVKLRVHYQSLICLTLPIPLML